MRKKWYFIAPLAVIAMALFVFLGGEVVMRLWNWLAPELFGGRQIGFWQALGLLALCRILFGNLGGGRHGSGSHWRRSRCAKMTPEERERFRQGIHPESGGPEPPSGADDLAR